MTFFASISNWRAQLIAASGSAMVLGILYGHLLDPLLVFLGLAVLVWFYSGPLMVWFEVRFPRLRFLSLDTSMRIGKITAVGFGFLAWVFLSFSVFNFVLGPRPFRWLAVAVLVLALLFSSLSLGLAYALPRLQHRHR